MAGISLTLSNIFQLISILSPILIMFFLAMVSIINTDIKWLIFIGGLLISSIINILFMNLIKSPIKEDASYMCNLIEIPLLTKYNNPNMSSLVLGFTIAYLFLPMIFNKQLNIAIVILLLSIFVMDSITKVLSSCTTILGTVLGGLLGFVLGSTWYAIFQGVDGGKHLYFSELMSNKVVCQKPSTQTFKCSVYKNGQLISNI